jgi:hypothetical protein
MKARFLKHSALDHLRSNIATNLAIYRSGNFTWLVADPSNWFEVDHLIDWAALRNLRDPEGSSVSERKNCADLFQAMRNISPYEARDERLWTYLTHIDLLAYSRKRWPIPDDDVLAEVHIRKHFFAGDKRGVERDNAASRLWWMAHLCSRASGLTIDRALETLLYRSDVRANIIERPTSSQIPDLFAAIVRKLSLSMDGKQALFDRDIFRQFMREINTVGGFKLLDCMSGHQIDELVDEIVTRKMSISSL